MVGIDVPQFEDPTTHFFRSQGEFVKLKEIIDIKKELGDEQFQYYDNIIKINETNVPTLQHQCTKLSEIE